MPEEREPSLLGRPAEGAAAAPGSQPKAATARPVVPPPASPASPPVAARRGAAPTFHAAGFWRRLGGGLIDLGIVLPVAALLCLITGKIIGVELPPSRHHGPDFWLDLFLDHDPALFGAIGLTLAIGAIYALVFQITGARTVGMRVTKTRIIDVYGDPPSIGRAVARTAGYLAGVLTLGLGFLWIGFDSEKRGLQDWLAGTYVVKV